MYQSLEECEKDDCQYDFGPSDMDLKKTKYYLIISFIVALSAAINFFYSNQLDRVVAENQVLRTESKVLKSDIKLLIALKK